MDPLKTRAKFNEIRSIKQAAFLKVQATCNYAYKVLLDCGRFYKEGDRLYYFYDKTKKVIFAPIKSTNAVNSVNAIIMDMFRYSSADNNYNQFYQQLYQMAWTDAKEATLNKLSYYNGTAGKLYISNHNSGMFVLDGENITEESNGYDDVIFHTLSDFEIINPDYENYKNDNYLDRNLFNRIWFSGSSVELQRIRFREWFFSLFFPNLQNEKPLMIMQGEAGSGKTATLEAIGILIQGSEFATSVFTNNQTDLITILHNKLFLIFDNIDGAVPSWFMDMLASTTTGGGISVRRLYASVDEDMITFKPKVFIAATSRTPRFNRDDIATRSIVCSLAKPKDDNYGIPLQHMVTKYRQRLWAHMLHELNNRVAAFKEDHKNYTSKFRIAPIVNIAVKSNAPEIKGYIKYAFDTLEESQSEFNLANNQTFEQLLTFVASKDYLRGTNNRWTATELYEYFRDNYQRYSVRYKSPAHLGASISKIAGFLPRYIGFEKTILDGISRYEFGPEKQNPKSK